MAGSLAGKTALVTGASGGIGGETAKRLAAAGAKVAVNYHKSQDKADAIVDAIRGAGGTAIAIGGDAADGADTQRIVAETVAALGGLDILVNNAGISTMMTFGEIDAATIDREFAVNVRSVLLMSQAAAAHLEGGGRIVNVSSNLAVDPMPGLTVYSAAKAAVACLTQGLAKELGPRGIRVNAVSPGATRTPMTDWIGEDIWSGIASNTPLGRVAEADDIADVVLFLASDESRWVNGRSILVDGGLA